MSFEQKSESFTKSQLHKKWIDYCNNHDRHTRDEFVIHYLPIVKGIAKRMMRSLQGHVELDDLISSGCFGLMAAIDAFDPNRGFAFETYCGHRIRGAMLDEIRAMDWVPRLVRQEGRALNNAKSDLTGRNSRKPSEEELAAELAMPMEKISNIVKNEKRSHL